MTRSASEVILTTFDDLDNAEDITMFEEYLLKNISLYFEKYEGELQTDVTPPAETEDAVPDEDLDGETETDVPEFELQEVMKLLDIDYIIENLL